MNVDSTHQVVRFSDIPPDALARFGGKAIGLAALVRAGLPVPDGFCVPSDAFLVATRPLRSRIEALDATPPGALAEIRRLAAELRGAVEALPLEASLREDIERSWTETCKDSPVAVRSSATAEDLADASFAGQQDTYLGIRGSAEVVNAVRRCWASLFTDRAVSYRLRHGVPSVTASMGVVVQRMVEAESAGVVFTADPTTGHRGVVAVEAVRGLGEALVGGHATPDAYKIRRSDGVLLEVKASTAGRILSDDQLGRLVALARAAEAARGAPQDVEWAIEGGVVYLLQARPITTLNPVPEPPPEGYRVYLSFGHIQVNTALLSPFTLSTAARMVPLDRDANGRSRVLVPIGGRLYADATTALVVPLLRERLLGMLLKMSPQVAERLGAVLGRPELKDAKPARGVSLLRLAFAAIPVFLRAVRVTLSSERGRRARYEALLDRGVEAARRKVHLAKGIEARLRAAREVLDPMFEWLMFRGAIPVLLPTFASQRGLQSLLRRYAPELPGDALLRGLKGNLTTEMDLELGDLTDLARPAPSVRDALASEQPVEALAALRNRPEAQRFLAAWDTFINRYGQRAAGEIDVSVVRWRENPAPLLRSIAASLGQAPGRHRDRQREVEAESGAAIERILRGARQGALGGPRALLVRTFIRHARALHALREHHKVALTQVLDLVRTVALEAGARLVTAGFIARRDDVWLLELEELQAALRPDGLTVEEVRRRITERAAFRARYLAWSPPPVLTSEGEAVAPPAGAQVPDGVLVGTGVSSGVMEGVVRVVTDPNRESLAPGEILVAPFTDPGWTPLFMRAGGVVTEVGGTMTHGSVVARELGIPAVVGVDGATRRLRSGQRVRLDADRGWITVLDEGSGAVTP